MSRYLYITDVYCPWCYAFGLVFDKVLARYPMPVSVLCGELVSPGYTIDDMVMCRTSGPSSRGCRTLPAAA